MTRESNDDLLRLVILMTRVCDDFCDTLITPCTPKSLPFVTEIIYGYNKIFDEGKTISKSFLTYKFGSQKILKVHLKQCDNEVLPKLQGTTLHVNFKQATLLALIKLKQIIKLRNYRMEYLNTPRSVLNFTCYSVDFMLVRDMMFSDFNPFDYERRVFEIIIGVCISAYEDAHLIDGSGCHVAILYMLMTCKDLYLRNQRLEDVIEKFESVGKPFDRRDFCIHIAELFGPFQMEYNKFKRNIRMCDANNNICDQLEEDDMLSLDGFREYPILVATIKMFNEFRKLMCPFKERHYDFYGLVKLFELNVD